MRKHHKSNFKKFRICNGVEPPNRHSGYASGFHLVQTTRDPGEQLRQNNALKFMRFSPLVKIQKLLTFIAEINSA